MGTEAGQVNVLGQFSMITALFSFNDRNKYDHQKQEANYDTREKKKGSRVNKHTNAKL